MSDRSNIRSLKNYGIHGALALLIGVGIGLAVTFVLLILPLPLSIGVGIRSVVTFVQLILPSLLSETIDPTQIPYHINPITLIFTTLVFLIFGGYIGYIFECHRGFSRLVITGAIAGAICGIASGGLLEIIIGYRFNETYGGPDSFVIYIIIMGIAGLIFGFPKIKSMLILLASGILGGTAGFGFFVTGQHITIVVIDIVESFQSGMEPNILTSIASLSVIAIMLGFFLFAIGTAGALLAIGIYYSNGITHAPKELPQYLKITQIIGIGLAVVLLSIISTLSAITSDYASTSTSVKIISDSDNITLYIPVMMDNNGNVLEMYESPTITGSATVAVINTKYGPALKIKGNSKEIEIDTIQKHGIQQGYETNEKFIEGFSISISNLSLYDNVTYPLAVDVWVFSDNEIKDCSIRYNIDTGREIKLSMFTEYDLGLRQEWQKVRLSRSIKCID